MNKYKVGDKIVLTVTGMTEMGGYPFYVLNDNFNLWEQSTDKYSEPLSTYTEQARADGAETAWELVRKIFDMETNDIEDIFIKEDAWNLGTVLNNYTYQEAAAKVAEWEKAKEEIKVGDVVSHEEKYGVVISEGTICFRGFTDDGTPFEWYKERCTKTGRHIDIDSFLKQIGEE